MEWLDRMNRVLDYLEDSLDGDPDINEAARIACCSPFHFQRMFYMLTDFTIAEYVRKRRLTLAAQELASSETKVIDVALKYGYESPESFCKAFRKIHGINPSQARDSGRYLQAFPRLSIHVSLKGDEAIKYRLISRENFKIAGKSIRVSMGDKKDQIFNFWQNSLQNGFCAKLDATSGESGKIGACMDFLPEKEEFTYFLGIEKLPLKFPKEWEEKIIPAANWAVFESRGPIPQAVEKLRQRIYSEWFPATGYEQAECTEFETFPAGTPSDPNYYSEIWIPIIKR